MNKRQQFFLYLLECYACDKARPTADVLKEWDSHGITQRIQDNYEQYHIEAIENAYADIDNMLASGQFIEQNQ